ncbi:hypothetical protein PWT90_07632 [Aphanocladium album]|nr:hypothetical protein PWT90_07632 [Aphanocladium album]
MYHHHSNARGIPLSRGIPINYDAQGTKKSGIPNRVMLPRVGVDGGQPRAQPKAARCKNKLLNRTCGVPKYAYLGQCIQRGARDRVMATAYESTSETLHGDSAKRYVESFISNALVLYPIMHPQEVRQLFRQCLVPACGVSPSRPDMQLDLRNLKVEMEHALFLVICALGKHFDCQESEHSLDQAKPTTDGVPPIALMSAAQRIVYMDWTCDEKLLLIKFHILASLFYDQLDQPLISVGNIVHAEHLLHTHMERYAVLDRKVSVKSDKYIRELRITSEKNADFRIMDSEKTRLALIFWTCRILKRQLTYDIQPPYADHLFQYESWVPYPDLSLVSDVENVNPRSYLNEMSLIRRLNEIDNAKNRPKLSKEAEFAFFLIETFAFDGDHGQARNSMFTRRRTRFWRAQVLARQRFLRQTIILQSNTKTDILNHPEMPPSKVAGLMRPPLRQPIFYGKTF